MAIGISFYCDYAICDSFFFCGACLANFSGFRHIVLICDDLDDACSSLFLSW